MRIALVVVAVLAVGGCQNFDNVRRALGSPPMVRTEKETDLEAHGQALDSMRAFLRRYDLVAGTGSATKPTMKVTIAPATSPASPPGATASPSLTFSTNGGAVDINSTQYPALLQAYVGGRREQIDGLCTQFFDGLQTLASGTQLSQDSVNILANTAGVIGGLTEASAKKLAILSGMQIAVNDTFNATKSALLLSPAPNSVFQLVRAQQSAILATSTPPLTFEQAERQVRGYALPCTQNGIKDLIEEALKRTADARTGEGVNRDLVVSSLAPILPILNEGAAAKVSTLGAADAVSLYWAFILADGAGEAEAINAQQAAALASMDAAVKVNVEAALKDAGRKARIVGAMQTVAASHGWVATDARKAQAAFASASADKAKTDKAVADAKQEADEAKTTLEEEKRKVAEAGTLLANAQAEAARQRTAAAEEARKAAEAADRELTTAREELRKAQAELTTLRAAQKAPEAAQPQ